MDLLFYIELILAIYLCLDWLFFLLMAENRLAYLFRVQSFITYITVPASFFSLFSTQIELIDTYELVFMKVIRLLSIGRLEELFKRKNMPLGRAIFSLTFESIAMIMIFASGMLRIENRYRQEQIDEIRLEDPDWEEDSSLYILRFHDLIYYTVVTITTTGYGDISPNTVGGQILFIVFFVSILVILPSRVGNLQKMSSLTSAFDRVVYKSNQEKQHFLLLGDSEPEAMDTFLSECFHSDHGRQETEIIILRDSEPDERINQILKKP